MGRAPELDRYGGGPRGRASWGWARSRGLVVSPGGLLGDGASGRPSHATGMPYSCAKDGIRTDPCPAIERPHTPRGRSPAASPARGRSRELVAACLLRSDLAFAGWPPCDSPRLSLLGYLLHGCSPFPRPRCSAVGSSAPGSSLAGSLPLLLFASTAAVAGALCLFLGR